MKNSNWVILVFVLAFVVVLIARMDDFTEGNFIYQAIIAGILLIIGIVQFKRKKK